MSFTGNMPATLFWECLLRIFLAALCGLVIGFERKARLKEAGVRTHLIVALGAALITIVSKYGFFDLALFAEGIKADPTRIAAQIVSGVGFLGAGMIFMRHRTLTGCCFSKRMRKLFIKNEKSVLRFCNKSSKTKRAFTKVLMPCKRPF